MINFFKRMLNSWHERQNKQDFNNGYDYAAGSLLRGEETPASLENKIDYGECHPFDKGMNAAIDKLTHTNFIPDDRSF